VWGPGLKETGAAALVQAVEKSAGQPEGLGYHVRLIVVGAAAAAVAAGAAAEADAAEGLDDQSPVVSGLTTNPVAAGLAPRGVQIRPVEAAAGRPDQCRLHHHHVGLAFCRLNLVSLVEVNQAILAWSF